MESKDEAETLIEFKEILGELRAEEISDAKEARKQAQEEIEEWVRIREAFPDNLLLTELCRDLIDADLEIIEKAEVTIVKAN